MSTATKPVTADDIHRAIDARDMEAAIALAERALAEGLEHPSALNLVAYKLELDGKLEAALGILNRALRISPDDPFILNSIGVCQSKLERPLDALRAFDAALQVAPNFPQAHNGRGLALSAIGQRDAARQAQRAALNLDRNFPEPYGALAAMAAEDKEWAAARDLASHALRLDPEQPAATMAMAAVELDAGDNAAAEARMTELVGKGRLTAIHLASALNNRADARHALGRFEEAMADYIAANRELRMSRLPALNAPELGLDICHRLLDYFEAADPAAWRAVPETTVTEEAGHVFLVGFPRSGTTLLEQVLASHAAMAPLEEKPTLDDSILEFFNDNFGLDRLSALDTADAQRWRDLYWRRVREFGVEPKGKVFVDKLPLHTIYLPLIAKLFPRAKILMARRDPRDVVVSCLRHRFKSNPLTVEFNDLGRTAQVYAATMDLADIYAEKLALPTHVHRLEDMIEDLDGQTQAICDFLGVPWDENMRNFVETANRRDIRTPSAGQVRKGLNREGVGAWRRYGHAIDEIKPILAARVAAYGYPAD